MAFKKNKYTHVYILDKVNKPAIAAKLSGIKNIIGPGIGNQKKWLTVNNFLADKDWNLSYSEQSKKLLEINNIKLNGYLAFEIGDNQFMQINKLLILNGFIVVSKYKLINNQTRCLLAKKVKNYTLQ